MDKCIRAHFHFNVVAIDQSLPPRLRCVKMNTYQTTRYESCRKLPYLSDKWNWSCLGGGHNEVLPETVRQRQIWRWQQVFPEMLQEPRSDLGLVVDRKIKTVKSITSVVLIQGKSRRYSLSVYQKMKSTYFASDCPSSVADCDNDLPAVVANDITIRPTGKPRNS